MDELDPPSDQCFWVVFFGGGGLTESFLTVMAYPPAPPLTQNHESAIGVPF